MRQPLPQTPAEVWEWVGARLRAQQPCIDDFHAGRNMRERAAIFEGGMKLMGALILPRRPTAAMLEALADEGLTQEELVPQARNMSDGESSLLPTPCASMWRGAAKKRFKGSPHYKGSFTIEALRTSPDDPQYMEPDYCETIMGFPAKWTELEPSEMPSSRNKPIRSSARSRKSKASE